MEKYIEFNFTSSTNILNYPDTLPRRGILTAGGFSAWICQHNFFPFQFHNPHNWITSEACGWVSQSPYLNVGTNIKLLTGERTNKRGESHLIKNERAWGWCANRDRVHLRNQPEKRSFFTDISLGHILGTFSM